MNFLTTAMIARRTGLPMEHSVRVLEVAAVLMQRSGVYGVDATIMADGQLLMIRSWNSCMTLPQAQDLVGKVKSASTLDAGMWGHI